MYMNCSAAFRQSDQLFVCLVDVIRDVLFLNRDFLTGSWTLSNARGRITPSTSELILRGHYKCFLMGLV